MIRWWPTLGETLDWLRDDADLTEPVDADAARSAARARPEPPPWFLSGVLFAGGLFTGWVATCTIGPFLALAIEAGLPSPAALFVPALILLLLCYPARWFRPGWVGAYADPVLFAGMISAKALYVGGAFALAFDVLGLAWNDGGAAAAMAALAVVELVQIALYPDRAHRIVATLLALGWTAGALAWLDILPVRDAVTGFALGAGAVAIALRPVFAGTPLRGLFSPVGFALSAYGLGGMARFWRGWAEEGWILYIGGITGLFALGITAWTLLRVRAPWHGWLVGLFAASLFVALGLGLPGLSAALAVGLLAILSRDAMTLTAAIVAIIAFGAWSWVDLDWPIAAKSAGLIGTGAVLLLLRSYLRRVVPSGDAPAETAPDDPGEDGRPGPAPAASLGTRKPAEGVA